MDSRVAFWTQVLTALGLIIGLSLVVFELRQAQQLARVQLLSETLTLAANSSLAQAGEESYVVIDKACREEKLDSSEMVIFDALMSAHAMRALRLWLIPRTGGFSEDEYYFGVRAELAEIFRTELGKRWWRSESVFLRDGLREFGDAWLDEFPEDQSCRYTLEYLSS